MTVIETEIETKEILKDELYRQYNWYHNYFLAAMQKACDEFFLDLFSLQMVSLSRNVNVLFQGDEYFVTKIRVDKETEVFLRCSAEATKILLESVLGLTPSFNISKITQLEAKIISSFNDYLYNSISKYLTIPKFPKDNKNAKFTKKKTGDFIHITFFIKEKKSDSGAKLILSIPKEILAPKVFRPLKRKFDISSYKKCKVDVKIKLGKTKFSLKDIKNLEKDDIVVFDESNIHKMTLVFGDYERVFKVAPNLNLITSNNNTTDNNGGDSMEVEAFSQSLWDNIQIDMSAEFEKVKITLGELKNIEQGLVVDIGSVYGNKVSLKVENKIVAEGELVIINDRYGVRIEQVSASEKTIAMATPKHKEHIKPAEGVHKEHEDEEHEDTAPEAETEETTATDEEFDYSDFELEDEDI